MSPRATISAESVVSHPGWDKWARGEELSVLQAEDVPHVPKKKVLIFLGTCNEYVRADVRSAYHEYKRSSFQLFPAGDELRTRVIYL